MPIGPEVKQGIKDGTKTGLATFGILQIDNLIKLVMQPKPELLIGEFMAMFTFVLLLQFFTSLQKARLEDTNNYTKPSRF